MSTQWTTLFVAVPNGTSKNVNELKQHLSDVWYCMVESIIESAINEWRMRLQVSLP